MMPENQKLTPMRVVLIVIMCVASVLFFFYKDKLIPNPNAGYKTHAQTFLKAEGTIVALDVAKGRRNSGMEYTIQFRDTKDSLITVSMRQWTTIPLKQGEKVGVYYNPEDPYEAIDEKFYWEIMK